MGVNLFDYQPDVGWECVWDWGYEHTDCCSLEPGEPILNYTVVMAPTKAKARIEAIKWLRKNAKEIPDNNPFYGLTIMEAHQCPTCESYADCDCPYTLEDMEIGEIL